MPVIFAVLGAPLVHFAEGVILGATVYLAIHERREQSKK